MAHAPHSSALTAPPDLRECQGGQGKAWSPGPSQLPAVGYVEREYVVRGAATSSGDGEPATYVTRILLRQPAKSEQFNGTVVVEWLDTAGSVETAPEWAATQPELVRGGFGWAGVSVEYAGICAPDGLKAWDPERYADLRHPGDEYSHDMFSQAGRAVRDVMRGARLLAAGMSGSAHQLATYINNVDPAVGVFDGFLVHCPPASVRFRDNPRVPVLVLQTEGEVASPEYAVDDQPGEDFFRLWEIAGAAQTDSYLHAVAGLDPLRRRPSDIIAALAKVPNRSGGSGPQHYYVASAALHHLNRCVSDGVSMPRGDRLSTVPNAPHILKRDAHGNALGGVRTPWMDVPTALLTGVDPESAGLAAPFPAGMLTKLYPTVDAYQRAFDAATEIAVDSGFLLRADAAEIKEIAAITYVMSLTN